MTTHHVSTPQVDHVATLVLSGMSLEDKVGQMIQADVASIAPADLRRYKLGSILAGGNAAPSGNVRSSAQSWLDLTEAYYDAAMDGGEGGHPRIPPLFGIDAVHGHAKVRGATIFPHNIALGAAHDPDLVRRIGGATAAEVAATGIDWTFAPTVAVARDVRWGRSYESYSESPELVALYAPAMVAGLQGELGTPQFMAPGHTLATVKHFLGDGGTQDGRDQGNTVLGEVELSRVHAAGYAPAIDAGAMIVMASYNSWNGDKLHGNRYLLTEVLKGRMGFDGFVVGDWNAHEQLPGCTKVDCPAAVLAGVDMLMAPDSWKELYDNLLAEVRAGTIPAARIDDAVLRILRVKVAAGLFERGPPKDRPDAGRLDTLGTAEHRAIAREAVRKSLVLLKNSHHLLPLDPHARVLVAGAGADDIGMQSGGWTIDWQGDHNSNGDFPGATSIFAGIAAAVARSGGSADLHPDGHFTARPDVAILVFGEAPYAEFQGDRETLEFSPGDRTTLALLRHFHALGVPTVSVFLSGRPLWVNREINASDAFVAAWLPGSEGEGIADVLFGARDGTAAPFDFKGRLAFAWPNTAMPVTSNAAGKASGAVFAAGYGLDYHSHAAVLRLASQAHIPPGFAAPSGSLFFAGHPTAPWSMFVADGEAEVHVTNVRQSSPHGAVAVTLRPEGARVVWNGTGEGMLRMAGRSADLRAGPSDGAALRVRYRVEQRPGGAVSLGMRCTEPLCGTVGGAMLDMTAIFRRAAVGVWDTLTFPVSCIGSTGADLRSVEVPFAIAATGAFEVTIAEISLAKSSRAAAAPCPAPATSGR